MSDKPVSVDDQDGVTRVTIGRDTIHETHRCLPTATKGATGRTVYVCRRTFGDGWPCGSAWADYPPSYATNARVYETTSAST